MKHHLPDDTDENTPDEDNKHDTKRRKLEATVGVDSPAYVTDPATKEDAGRIPGYASNKSNEAASRLMQSEGFRASRTSAAGNDFIDGFYKNSRLHHLSTWKSELKLLVTEAQERAEKIKDVADGFVQAEDTGNASVQTTKSSLTTEGVSMRGAVLPKSPSKGKGRAQDAKMETVIMHVDFDCFFVSVSLLDRPHLREQPVVVCHSQGTQGGSNSTSEISSASYKARELGIKAGMSLQQARKLCPGVATVPYEFEKYKQMSLRLYTVLMVHSDDLQAVSVDEALIDVSSGVQRFMQETEIRHQDPAKSFAEMLRKKVRESTGCEVSIGISHNIMLARLATRKAKPAGSFHLKVSELHKFIVHMQVDDLHGFGRATRDKALEKLGVSTLGELSKKPKSVLCDALGKTTGETLYNAVRGVDNRKLESDKPRKSVSAEINYGIRFENSDQARAFIFQLSEEVARRLDTIEMHARSMTLKIMVRDPGAPVEPPKFMGHGICTIMNKQSALHSSNGKATSDPLVLGQQAWLMLKSCKVDPRELRGIGIQVQKLEKVGTNPTSEGGKAQRKLTDFGVPKSDAILTEETTEMNSCVSVDNPLITIQAPSQEDKPAEESSMANDSTLTENIPLILPSLSQVDLSALEELPEDLRDEIDREYRRQRSESLSNSRSMTPARPFSLTDGSTLRVGEENPLFEEETFAKMKTTSRGTPLSRISQALGPKGRSSVSPHKHNILERAKLASSPKYAPDPLIKPGTSSTGSAYRPKVASSSNASSSSRQADSQPRKSSSVRVSMDELRTLGIDAQVYASLPVDIQLEQLSRARFERSFGKK